MTKFDIKNYLNKIYDVHPVKVNTRIALGKTKKCPAGGYIIKEDDIKIAYVTLVNIKSKHIRFMLFNKLFIVLNVNYVITAQK